MKNGNCPPLWAQCLCYLYKKITVKRNSDGSERAAVNHFFYMWIKQLFSESSHCTAACCMTMKTSQLTVSLPHCSPAAAWPLTSLLATCRRNSSRLETEPAATVPTCQSEADDSDKNTTRIQTQEVDTDERKKTLVHVLMKYISTSSVLCRGTGLSRVTKSHSKIVPVILKSD